MPTITLHKQQIINRKLPFNGFQWWTASHPCGQYSETFQGCQIPNNSYFVSLCFHYSFFKFFHLIAPHPIFSPKFVIPSARLNEVTTLKFFLPVSRYKFFSLFFYFFLGVEDLRLLYWYKVVRNLHGYRIIKCTDYQKIVKKLMVSSCNGHNSYFMPKKDGFPDHPWLNHVTNSFIKEKYYF